MKTSDQLWAALDAEPWDPTVLGVLADALEEEGDPEGLAAGLRWAYRTRKWPAWDYGRFSWFSEVPSLWSRPAQLFAILPSTIWDAIDPQLEEIVIGRSWARKQEAFKALARAYAAAGEQAPG